MLDPELKKNIKDHCNYAIGIINGEKNMLLDGRDLIEIYECSLAAEGILHKINNNFFDEALRKDLWLRMKQFLLSETASPQAIIEVRTMKTNYHTFTFPQVYKALLRLYQLNEIADKISDE